MSKIYSLKNWNTDEIRNVDETEVENLFQNEEGWTFPDNSQLTFVTPKGELYETSEDEAPDLIKSGFRLATQEQLQQRIAEEKYGDSELEAAGLGVARGLTFGLSDQLLEGAGVYSSQELSDIKKVNPVASTLGEVGSIITPSGFAKMGIKGVAKVGEKAASKVVQQLAKKGITGSPKLFDKAVSKIAPITTQSIVEGAFYGGGQVISEDALGNVELNGENLARGILQGAIIGGGFGVGLGGTATAIGGTAGQIRDQIKKRFLPKASPKLLDEYQDVSKQILQILEDPFTPAGQEAREKLFQHIQKDPRGPGWIADVSSLKRNIVENVNEVVGVAANVRNELAKERNLLYKDILDDRSISNQIVAISDKLRENINEIIKVNPDDLGAVFLERMRKQITENAANDFDDVIARLDNINDIVYSAKRDWNIAKPSTISKPIVDNVFEQLGVYLQDDVLWKGYKDIKNIDGILKQIDGAIVQAAGKLPDDIVYGEAIPLLQRGDEGASILEAELPSIVPEGSGTQFDRPGNVIAKTIPEDIAPTNVEDIAPTNIDEFGDLDTIMSYQTEISPTYIPTKNKPTIVEKTDETIFQDAMGSTLPPTPSRVDELAETPWDVFRKSNISEPTTVDNLLRSSLPPTPSRVDELAETPWNRLPGESTIRDIEKAVEGAVEEGLISDELKRRNITGQISLRLDSELPESFKLNMSKSIREKLSKAIDENVDEIEDVFFGRPGVEAEVSEQGAENIMKFIQKKLGKRIGKAPDMSGEVLAQQLNETRQAVVKNIENQIHQRFRQIVNVSNNGLPGKANGIYNLPIESRAKIFAFAQEAINEKSARGLVDVLRKEGINDPIINKMDDFLEAAVSQQISSDVKSSRDMFVENLFNLWDETVNLGEVMQKVVDQNPIKQNLQAMNRVAKMIDDKNLWFHKPARNPDGQYAAVVDPKRFGLSIGEKAEKSFQASKVRDSLRKGDIEDISIPSLVGDEMGEVVGSPLPEGISNIFENQKNIGNVMEGLDIMNKAIKDAEDLLVNNASSRQELIDMLQGINVKQNQKEVWDNFIQGRVAQYFGEKNAVRFLEKPNLRKALLDFSPDKSIKDVIENQQAKDYIAGLFGYGAVAAAAGGVADMALGGLPGAGFAGMAVGKMAFNKALDAMRKNPIQHLQVLNIIEKNNGKIAQNISKVAKGLVNPDSQTKRMVAGRIAPVVSFGLLEQVPKNETKDQQITRIIKDLEALEQNPALLHNKISIDMRGKFSNTAPGSFSTGVQNASRILQQLRQKIPVGAKDIEGNPVMTETEKSDFLNDVKIAFSPEEAMDKIMLGEASQKEIQTLRELYPLMFQNLQQEIIMELQKNKVMPSVKLQMKLRGILDDSAIITSRNFVMAIQSNYRQPETKPQNGGGSKLKIAQAYQTPIDSMSENLGR